MCVCDVRVTCMYIHTVPNKWPRKYERVTELEDVDPNDLVAFTKARHQRERDRFVTVLMSMTMYNIYRLYHYHIICIPHKPLFCKTKAVVDCMAMAVHCALVATVFCIFVFVFLCVLFAMRML